METGFVLLAAAAVLLLGFLWIGAPILLTTWFRKRRGKAAALQIALTDALDGTFGMLVAPVVKKPILGGWQIHLALPFSTPALVARILAVTHEVLSAGDPLPRDRYQLILTPQQDPIRIGREIRPLPLTARRPSDAIAA